MSGHMETENGKGKVYLVGAGPGDPGLITVKGRECINKADVIVYDYLASPTLLKYAPQNAEMIYVGKKGGDHTLSQDGINRLLVEKASGGAVVTRLKGGDPFIFGRGGEEVEVLVEHGIGFEIVPGVTSAIAAPAYAGIPLTHRRFASTVSFVTGHEDPLKSGSSIDWKNLGEGSGTIVFLMGMKNLGDIARLLMENGRNPKTPTAIVRWGTTTRQRVVSGTLKTIFDRAKEAGITSPAIIVVGDVVGLRDAMQWFEKRPLSGMSVVVTRARAQAGKLSGILEEAGARCLECPVIKIAPPDDPLALERLVEGLSSYDWLVFTSVNGVSCFFKTLFEKKMDARCLSSLKTAVIGPATEKRLLEFGIKSDVVPETYRAESIISAFQGMDVAGKRIALPRAKDARPILPVELRKMGATVDEVISYQAKPVSDSGGPLLKNLEEKKVDMVTFTSSSTVKNFAALLPSGRQNELMESVAVASIGPITTETAEGLGFHVDVTAKDYTMDGLVQAILEWKKGR